MADIVLVGLDISSRCTGWSKYINGELVDYGCLDYRKDKSPTDVRRNLMCKAILKKLSEINPDIVVVEEEVIGSSTTTRLLAMIIGCALSWALAKNKEFHMIQPSQWRSIVAEQGKSYPKKREDVKPWDIQRCKEIFGIEAEDDVADGILVGWAYIKNFKGE